MKSYKDFLAEKVVLQASVISPIEMPKYSINFSDESLEMLRNKLLDKYFANEKDKEKQHLINRCISTYVYTLDKKLKIDSDIIDLLAKLIGKTAKETAKDLQEETDNFYGETQNLYGQNSG